MRRAELVMAVVMALFSVYLMWKSAELPIGWIPDEGPGGGAFSFWLSAGMLACCVAIIVRWFMRTSPPSRSSEPYMDRHALKLFLIGAGALTVMVASIHFIGVYGAVPLFLIFYMRFLGHHSWTTTATLAAVTPVVAFFFFEIALRITLPKGYTEPLFYPLYDIFF
ncbi:MAG: tripartite tricarboxylate transporter TctB family protein [Acidiferrobacterales bacterium]